MLIRAQGDSDRGALWGLLEPVIRVGEAYALPRDMSMADALAYWLDPAHRVFFAVEDGQVVGSYFLQANQRGGGAHVANCGYVSAPASQGRGIAFQMCEHSLAEARASGFRAMQFNYVVSTNERAVALWQRCGFAIVGRLPGAFAHPRLGDVDVLVMHRPLYPHPALRVARRRERSDERSEVRSAWPMSGAQRSFDERSDVREWRAERSGEMSRDPPKK